MDNCFQPSSRSCLFLAAVIFVAGGGTLACAQFGGTVQGSQFELADSVQLDVADNAVLAQWDRVKTLLADRQWDEAVEILRQMAEFSDAKLMDVGNRRYVSLREWRQLQLAALPPEALKLYRARVDPVARQWFEQGVAERSVRLLRNVVEQAFASRYGDDALLALGDMALESGDYATARRYWERIMPDAPAALRPIFPAWPGYPDTDLNLAAVGARLALASILAGEPGRAKAELAEFVRLHPDARGRLGEKEGKYADLLSVLVAESAAWKRQVGNLPGEWPTFAGNPRRNKIAPRLADVGAVAWRVRLRSAAVSSDRARIPGTAGEDPHEPLSFYPAIVDNIVFVGDSRQILAVRSDTGEPAWGRAAIFQDQLPDIAAPAMPLDVLGAPRFTATVFQNRLYARMGSPVTGLPQGSASSVQPGYLVCLDLAAEGRLMWKFQPEEGWTVEGSPVADDRGVYVAMRRHDIRPQAFVACLDADTGRIRWQRFVCSAETPARGAIRETTHNLLTLGGGTLYYNTNLGAVAAIRAEDGHPLWVSLYPRARRGDLANLAPHWRRDLNPCILHDGTLLAAPADSPRVFALDAATGAALWQTGTEVEDAVDLLGVADGWLIASGRKLYWISVREEDRGRVKHVWPQDAGEPGHGRGLLAGDSVLWPTRDKLYIFDRVSARPQKVIDLAARDVTGGNLLVADRRLLIATGSELIAIGLYGRVQK